MTEKLSYEAPRLDLVGGFEALTQGGTLGDAFDGNFTHGQAVPRDSEGRPLLLS